jgi:hypothetical protein
MLLANCQKLSESLDFSRLPPTQKGGLREFANNIEIRVKTGHSDAADD